MNGLGSAMVLTFDGGQVEDEADVLAAFGRVSNSDNFQASQNRENNNIHFLHT
jgi:hypothetical protein